MPLLGVMVLLSTLALFHAPTPAAGGSLIQLPTMGGSLPLYLIDQALQAPILILPIANHDSNPHGSNENPRLQSLWDAIGIHASVLTKLKPKENDHDF